MILGMSSDTKHTAVVRERGQVTLPAEVRQAAGIDSGTVLDVKVEEGRIVLTPQLLVDADQAWFWTERWQAMEKEADADFAAGRSVLAEDVESFLDELDV